MNNKHRNKIQLIITGGTIDSYYNTDKCTTIPHKISVLGPFLKKYIGINSERLEITEVCMKDSREITQEDIDHVSEKILSSRHNQHVIAHGTFTMFSSARYLKQILPNENGQVVVFTGSMIPLEGFAPNDAGFNLGAAFMAAQCIEPGVYVAFNGQLYAPEEIENLH